MRTEIWPGNPLTNDQKKWMDAVHFCDDMEGEATEAGDKELAEWWAHQSDICMSRVHKNVPYQEMV